MHAVHARPQLSAGKPVGSHLNGFDIGSIFGHSRAITLLGKFCSGTAIFLAAFYDQNVVTHAREFEKSIRRPPPSR
jgi:hypothetical protein